MNGARERAVKGAKMGSENNPQVSIPAPAVTLEGEGDPDTPELPAFPAETPPPSPPPATGNGFVYADEDDAAREISEFYSYAEIDDFDANRGLFEERLPLETGYQTWDGTPEEEREDFLLSLAELLECGSPEKRQEAACMLLYLAQGTFGEAETAEVQLARARDACERLWRAGIFGVCVQNLLRAVKECAAASERECGGEERALVRLYLNLTYLMVQLNKDIPAFAEELRMSTFEKRPLVGQLFAMVSDFNEPAGRHYPIKKMLLLLWKCLLVALGGKDDFEKVRRAKRSARGLPSDAPDMRATEQDVELYEDVVASRFRWQSASFGESGLCAAHAEGLEVLKRHVDQSPEENERQELVEDPATGAILPPPPDFVPRYLLPREDAAHPVMEHLYRLLLPNMSRYVIIILKILLAAVPTVKNYTGTINLNTELATAREDKKEDKKPSLLEAAMVAMDAARHKEVLVKAISAILHLLLQHCKSNHAYQFEYLCQLLVDANCILLILKFLNQDLGTFVTTINDQADMEFFPPPEDDSVESELSDAPKSEKAASWRNLFSSVNLLSVLELLTADYGVRVSTLIRYKAPAILKRLTKLEYHEIVVRALRLIRVQARALGRKWRSSNMQVISQIYNTITPDEMTDDWLCADIPAEHSDATHKTKDATLRKKVDAFNVRNYVEWRKYAPFAATVSYPENGLYDTWKAGSLRDDNASLAEEFKYNYEHWLELEVFTEEWEDEGGSEHEVYRTYLVDEVDGMGNENDEDDAVDDGDSGGLIMENGVHDVV